MPMDGTQRMSTTSSKEFVWRTGSPVAVQAQLAELRMSGNVLGWKGGEEVEAGVQLAQLGART